MVAEAWQAAMASLSPEIVGTLICFESNTGTRSKVKWDRLPAFHNSNDRLEALEAYPTHCSAITSIHPAQDLATHLEHCSRIAMHPGSVAIVAHA